MFKEIRKLIPGILRCTNWYNRKRTPSNPHGKFLQLHLPLSCPLCMRHSPSLNWGWGYWWWNIQLVDETTVGTKLERIHRRSQPRRGNLFQVTYIYFEINPFFLIFIYGLWSGIGRVTIILQVYTSQTSWKTLEFYPWFHRTLFRSHVMEILSGHLQPPN